MQDPVFKMIKSSKTVTAEEESKPRTLPLHGLWAAPWVTCPWSQLREQSVVGKGWRDLFKNICMVFIFMGEHFFNLKNLYFKRLYKSEPGQRQWKSKGKRKSEQEILYLRPWDGIPYRQVHTHTHHTAQTSFCKCSPSWLSYSTYIKKTPFMNRIRLT